MFRLRALIVTCAAASLVGLAAAVALAAPSAISRAAAPLAAMVAMYGGAPPDLTIEVSASATEVAPGDTVIYRIVVHNKPERGGATGVNVRFDVPEGLEIVSTKANRGPGFCTGTTKMSCFLDFMSSIHVGNVIVIAKTKVEGTVTLSVTVVSDEKDDNPSDNKASVKVEVKKPSLSQPGSNGPAGSGAVGGMRLIGSQRSETLRGKSGNDRIYGRQGDDRIYGLAGNDLLDGGPGRDLLFGGAGDDTLLAADGERDVLDCGPGRDTVRADAFDRVASNCETRR